LQPEQRRRCLLAYFGTSEKNLISYYLDIEGPVAMLENMCLIGDNHFVRVVNLLNVHGMTVDMDYFFKLLKDA
jgi:hypothetical protein